MLHPSMDDTLCTKDMPTWHIHGHGRNPNLENDISCIMQSTLGDRSSWYVRASSSIPNNIINACTQNKYNLALTSNTCPPSLAPDTSSAHLLLLAPSPFPHISTPCSHMQITHMCPYIASANTDSCATSVQCLPSFTSPLTPISHV